MAKNRIIFLIMVTVAFVDLSISGSRGSYIMLTSIFILACISAIMLLVSYFSIKIDESLDETFIIKGEKTRYKVEIFCKIPLMSEIRLHFKKPGASVSYELVSEAFYPLSGKELAVGCEVESAYRGICRIGVNFVEVYDFLKIFKLKKKSPKDTLLVVCPIVAQFSEDLQLLSPSEQAGLSKRAGLEDYADITDIRPYVKSDNMKRIHWKMSAKKDELHVKDYDNNNTTAMGIIIDNRKTPRRIAESYAIEDMLIETAVSIAKYNLSDNKPVMLDYMENEPARFYESTSAGFDKAYFALSTLEFDRESIEDLFLDYYNPNFIISAIYLLTANPDDKIIAFSKAMALKGNDINLVHFYENERGSIAESFKNTGVTYHGACLNERLKHKE